jgi:hypothetical protein
MDYQIIDDFLEESVFEQYLNTLILFRDKIPLYYVPYVASESNNSSFYFVHDLYKHSLPVSAYFDRLVLPLMENVRRLSLIRAKVNWYPKTPEVVEHAPHKDLDIEHKVLVFYVNTCNGFTRLGDDIVVESVENRALIFDGSIHNSATCSDKNLRCSINIDFI